MSYTNYKPGRMIAISLVGVIISESESEKYFFYIYFEEAPLEAVQKVIRLLSSSVVTLKLTNISGLSLQKGELGRGFDHDS